MVLSLVFIIHTLFKANFPFPGFPHQRDSFFWVKRFWQLRKPLFNFSLNFFQNKYWWPSYVHLASISANVWHWFGMELSVNADLRWQWFIFLRINFSQPICSNLRGYASKNTFRHNLKTLIHLFHGPTAIRCPIPRKKIFLKISKLHEQ